MDIAGDVLDGRSLKTSVKDRGIAAGKHVATRAVSRVTGPPKNNKRRRGTSVSTRRSRAKRVRRSQDVFD